MSGIYYSFNRFLERHMPEGLYYRSLMILIAPIVLLQTIMAGIILDNHWDNVTKALGRSLAREVGIVTLLYDQSDKSPAAIENIERIATDRLRFDLQIIRGAELPLPIQRKLYSLVDNKMTKYLERETGRPFWIDSSAGGGKVEIRVEAEKGLIFQIRIDEDRASAPGTVLFLVLMLISSIVVLLIAIAFLRKQISPIVDLAKAAKSFGMGREGVSFHPRGAREVRQAGLAFIDMKQRLSRHVEQRTAMLAGVSHDLRTILTRFKLELAMLGNGPKVRPLREDVDEMQLMLEAYLAFVRGDGGEATETINLLQVANSVAAAVGRGSSKVSLEVANIDVNVKPNAFRRLISNLMGNAVRYGSHVKVMGMVENRLLTFLVDDDGPGIAADKRDDAFRPFVRLDHARNLDETGTGLGLAIALDIARAHGGEITLGDSPMGGLRARVLIPV